MLRQVREHTPWTAEAPPSAVVGSAVLCPALRFLPSVGSFIAESAAAGLYATEFMVNLLANPFAVQEILVNRARGVCPPLPLGHGALADCGARLFSLDKVFGSIYAANTAFWDLVAWLASLVGGNTAAQAVFEGFLTGVAAYGDAGHIVSLFEVQAFSCCPSAKPCAASHLL
jgi:hypothetical protein